MTLESLMNARRTMDYLATSAPPNVFIMAKTDYLKKLKEYHETGTYEDQDLYEQFLVSETERTKQLTLFNGTGSNYVDPGDDKTVREGVADDRPKSSVVQSGGRKSGSKNDGSVGGER